MRWTRSRRPPRWRASCVLARSRDTLPRNVRNCASIFRSASRKAAEGPTDLTQPTPGLASSDDGSALAPSVVLIHHYTEVHQVVIEPLIPSAARTRATRRVMLGHVVVGDDTVPVIAGPCAVESGYVAHAEAVSRAGAAALRGCVPKPR